MESQTLAESLRDRAGWQPFNFGWTGPHPPYVRLGVRVEIDPFRLVPAFASFLPDRLLIFRSTVPVAEHLRQFAALNIAEAAFDEHHSRGYAARAGFPVDTWLRVARVDVDQAELTDGQGQRFALPLHVLCAASSVRVAARQ